jgi:hypothetical protein
MVGSGLARVRIQVIPAPVPAARRVDAQDGERPEVRD